MKAATLMSVCLLTLGLMAPARAGLFSTGGRDDCAPNTRHAKAEYGAEHERSKQLEGLDCCGLKSRAESERGAFNRWIQVQALRPPASTFAPKPREPEPVLETVPVPPPTAPSVFAPSPPRVR